MSDHLCGCTFDDKTDEYLEICLFHKKQMDYLAASEAKVSALETERDRLRETLMYISDHDWHWEGGGSNRRVRGKYGRFAAKALGVPLELSPDWPDPEKSETRADLSSLADTEEGNNDQ